MSQQRDIFDTLFARWDEERGDYVQFTAYAENPMARGALPDKSIYIPRLLKLIHHIGNDGYQYAGELPDSVYVFQRRIIFK